MKTSAIRAVFFYMLLCIGSAVLTACMWMPVAKDDFSVLGNDVFSNLIRASYMELVPKYEVIRGNAGAMSGYGRIEKTKAQEISRGIMLGKTAQEMIEMFKREGGSCKPFHLEKILVCEVVRKWKFKNIGAPIDTRYWSDPAAKLLYRFVLSESDVVVELELNIIDATEYKPIKG